MKIKDIINESSSDRWNEAEKSLRDYVWNNEYSMLDASIDEIVEIFENRKNVLNSVELKMAIDWMDQISDLVEYKVNDQDYEYVTNEIAKVSKEMEESSDFFDSLKKLHSLLFGLIRKGVIVGDKDELKDIDEDRIEDVVDHWLDSNDHRRF